MYLAFADHDRLKFVQSKVACMMGKALDPSLIPKKPTQADQIKQLMSPFNKNSEQEMARRIFE